MAFFILHLRRKPWQDGRNVRGTFTKDTTRRFPKSQDILNSKNLFAKLFKYFIGANASNTTTWFSIWTNSTLFSWEKRTVGRPRGRLEDSVRADTHTFRCYIGKIHLQNDAFKWLFVTLLGLEAVTWFSRWNKLSLALVSNCYPLNITSTGVRHQAESRDEMRWSP